MIEQRVLVKILKTLWNIKTLEEILVGKTRHWNKQKSNRNSNCTKLDV